MRKMVRAGAGAAQKWTGSATLARNYETFPLLLFVHTGKVCGTLPLKFANFGLKNWGQDRHAKTVGAVVNLQATSTVLEN
jgi:hypothetical protein